MKSALFLACALSIVTAGKVFAGSEFSGYHEEVGRILGDLLERSRQAPAAPAALSAPDSAPGVSRDEKIRRFANRYWKGREDRLRAALARFEQIRPTLEGILASQGVPTALAAVVLVESAANPMALSPKQARGLWQFIPATAERYGLSVQPARDDRIHLDRASSAAARYLKDLYAQFGDWELALAAYNAGEQAVANAIAKTGAPSFERLRAARLLPAETRAYVPAVLDAIELVNPGKRLDAIASFEAPAGRTGARSALSVVQPFEKSGS